MKHKVVKLSIIGTFLNIASFLILYAVAYRVPIAWLLLLMLFIPALINVMLMRKAVYKWKLRKQLVVFGYLAVVSCICFTLFSYFFENSAGYENYVITNLDGVQELGLNLKGRFFSPVSITCSFLFYLVFQIMTEGTRKEWTREEIEQFFDKHQKKTKKK